MLDFVGKRFWYFLLSAIIIVPGVISLILFRLEPGLDFSGGATGLFTFQEEVEKSELDQAVVNLGYEDARVDYLEERNSFLIKTPPLSIEEGDKLIESLVSEFGPLKEEDPQFRKVSADVAKERVRYAFYALLAASFGILIYISWAFRKVPNPFRYGVCAILALIHDVLVVVGIFSILGALFHTEVNAMFITGLLTVIGYSVHDTIVVFDRIRENMGRSTVYDLKATVNNSILETIARSLNTSLTTLVVLVALFLFAGGPIFTLLLVFLIGVITGTYSSIFIASQFLVVWESRDIGRFLKRVPLVRLLARRRAAS